VKNWRKEDEDARWCYEEDEEGENEICISEGGEPLFI